MRRRAAAACACLAALPGLAAAQEPRERPRDRATQVIERYFEQQVRQGLELNDEQFQRVMPLVRRFHQGRREMRERRMRALQELRRSLASGTATEEQVGGMVRGLKSLEQEEAQRLVRDRESVDAALTPLQQAKLRLMEVAIEHRVREARGRWRRGERGRGPREGRPPPRP